MIIRSFLAFSFVAGIALTASAQSTGRDSLPPLHTLLAADIDSIAASWENHDITVTLKNGTSLVYKPEEWDMEIYEPTLDKRFREAIRSISRTFTKAEHAPEFPGGEEGWNKFVADFCEKNKATIREEGSSSLVVQMIVHMRGQLTDVEVISNPGQSKLAAAFVQAIKDGPRWTPATQNGYTVICYKRVQARLAAD